MPLFNNQSKTKSAKLPIAAVQELVSYGVSAEAVRRMPVRQAWARLYAFRESGLSVSESQAKREAMRVSKLLAELASESDPSPHELTNAANEALSTLPADLLKRVCAGLANVLTEVVQKRNAA